MTHRRVLQAARLVLLLATFVTPAFAQPDPRQMSGMPLPVGDLEPGTVVVRLIRGSLDKPIVGQSVQIVSGGSTTATSTNDSGRAEFKGIPIGSRVRAVTTVDGERLESQEFGIPANGGIRVMLVAAAGAGQPAAPSAPAQAGDVMLGDQTRFVIELGDQSLSVFSIVQIVNRSQTAVQPGQPVVFELPDGAKGAGLLQGSSPQASAAGTRVVVAGPFAPGDTLVQFGYSLPYSGGDFRLEQTMPLPLAQVTLIAQKVGDMHVTSPQMAEHREMNAEGQTYIVGRGPALKAGDALTVAFTGLPHAPTWPRNLAVAFAIAILAAGAWGAFRPGKAVERGDARRAGLEAERDRLFGELTALEDQHRADQIDAQRYASRRNELVAALERSYAELDEEAAA